MTGDQRHREDTTFGQRVSQHSLRILLCSNFFPTAQMAHLVLPDTQANAQKTKRAIFSQRAIVSKLREV